MPQPNPKRRRLRFSLRTLFMVVTLIGVAAAWTSSQLKWIHDRHAALDRQEENQWGALVAPTAHYPIKVASVPAPWQLRLFGEQGVTSIIFMTDMEKRPLLQQRLTELFPEAKIVHLPVYSTPSSPARPDARP